MAAQGDKGVQPRGREASLLGEGGPPPERVASLVVAAEQIQRPSEHVQARARVDDVALGQRVPAGGVGQLHRRLQLPAGQGDGGLQPVSQRTRQRTGRVGNQQRRRLIHPAGVQSGVRHPAQDGRVNPAGGHQLAVEVQRLAPAALSGQACRQHVAGVGDAARRRGEPQGTGSQLFGRCEGMGVKAPSSGLDQQPRRQLPLTDCFEVMGSFLGRGVVPRQRLGRAPMQCLGLGRQQRPCHGVADQVVVETQPGGDSVDQSGVDRQPQRLLHRRWREVGHLGQPAVEATKDRGGGHHGTSL